MPTPIESRRANSGWPGKYRKWVKRPTAEQATVLEQLGQLGAERAELVKHKGYMTSAGRHNYDQVIGKIRKLIYTGHELGIGHEQMREQVGVNSSAYYKIKSGRTAS